MKMKNIAIGCCSKRATDTLSQSTPSFKNAVTSIYKVETLKGKQFVITVSWYRTPISHAFSITISFSTGKMKRNFEILGRKLGSENLVSGQLTAEVLWDLRRARYESGVEPVSGFYMAVVVNAEIGLVLGDMEQELNKCIPDFRVRVRGVEFSRISRGERSGNGGVYSGRVKFSEMGRWHDIKIRLCEDDATEHLESVHVYVDEKEVIEVKKLEMNFRGHDSFSLDGLVIDMFWDVDQSPIFILFQKRRGLDSRLWLEEPHNYQENAVFTFLLLTNHIVSVTFLPSR